METGILDKLFLELSQFTMAQTKKELIMKNALDKLARLGNEPGYGNSIGNCIAIDALREIGEFDRDPAKQDLNYFQQQV